VSINKKTTSFHSAGLFK